MVRLTVANILRGTSIYNKKRVDETSELALKRITHLHLEDMGIDDIGDDIRNCRNLVGIATSRLHRRGFYLLGIRL